MLPWSALGSADRCLDCKTKLLTRSQLEDKLTGFAVGVLDSVAAEPIKTATALYAILLGAQLAVRCEEHARGRLARGMDVAAATG